MIFVVEWHENEFGGESSRSHVEAESEQAAKEIFIEHHPEYEIECIYKYVEPELLRKANSPIKILELVHVYYACPSQ